MTYRLGDIAPNPFRDIENYPISEEKVGELIASYRTTRVWPNVIGRLADGKPQIAYGHHRLEAARRLYGDDFDFPLTIEDLSDDEMFRMMASENMEVYQASAQVVQNTIESLVKAYAVGKVHPATPPSKANEARYAPGFLLGSARGQDTRNPYTAETLRAYLGWTSVYKVKRALAALEQVERGTFDRADFEGLSTDQADRVVRAVQQAERSSKSPTRKHNGELVKHVREAVVREARAGGHRREIQEAAERVIEKRAPLIEKPKVPKEIALGLSRDAERFFSVGVLMPSGTISRREAIRLIAENRDAEELRGATAPWADQIATALDRLADEAHALAIELRQEVRQLVEVSSAN